MALASNLKIAQDLLATMQEVTTQLERQTEVYKTQVSFVEALCKAQECFDKVDANRINEIRDSLQAAGEKSKSFCDSLTEAGASSERLSRGTRNITSSVRKLSVPAEFLNGLKAGFNLAGNIGKGLMKLGGPVLGLMKDLGTIFKSLPGRVMDFFQGAASSGVDPYRVALEEVRKEFGNLDIGTSASIKRMTESTKSLGDSGLALSRVFGYGREGLAAMLRENLELFKGMGPLGNRLAASIRGAEGEFTLLRKATNLSADAFKSLQLSAEANGGDTASAVRNMTMDIARAERAFGISAKEYGKDIDFMMKETATFGVMAPKEMLKVSTYAKKLGVSMETLKKVMDKTMNFEDAAQQAAKLSEAFNIQVDAVKLMNEQDPTKKLDMIREGFFRAGKDIEKMTVLEKRYLAEQTNMSEEELRVAFSQKNRALTGAQVDAQMKKAQKTQITQQEAMQQLAKSIERLVQSGQAMKGGFFEVFMRGFFSGMQRTKEFRDVVIALQASLRHVFLAGRQVGQMFVRLFPGIQDILGGFKEMFDPARYKRLMDNVVAEFRNFFTLLKTDPAAGVQQFMTNMKKHFLDFFQKGSPAATKLTNGLTAFFKVIGIILVQGMKWALGQLRDAIRGMAGFIAGPQETTKQAAEVATGFKKIFRDAITYVVTELGPMLAEILHAIADFFRKLSNKIKEITDPTKGGFKGWLKRMMTPAPADTQDAMGDVKRQLLAGLIDVFNSLKEMSGTLSPIVADALEKIFKPALEKIGGSVLLMATLRGAMSALFTVGLPAAMKAVAPMISSTIMPALSSGLSSAFSFLQPIVSSILSAKGALVAIIAAIVGFTVGFMVNAKKTTDFANKVGDFFRNFGENIGKIIGKIIKAIGNAFIWIGEQIGKLVAKIILFFQSLTWSKVGGFFKKLAASFYSALATVGNFIVQFFGGLIVGILKALGLEKLADEFRNKLKEIQDFISDFTRNAERYFSDIYEIIIKPAFDKVVAFFVGIYESIKSFMKSAGEVLSSIWDTITSPFIRAYNFVSDLFTKISYFLKGVFISIVIEVSSFITKVVKFFSDLGNTLKAPFVAFFDFASGIFTRVGDVIKNDLNRLGNWFSEHNPLRAIQGAMQTVANVANRIFGHSINTVIAADLKKVKGPAEDLKQTLSSSLEEGFKKASESSKNHSKSIGNNIKSIDNVADGFASSGERASQITSHLKDKILRDVSDMISSYNQFTKELSSVGRGTRPIEIALKNIGSALGARQTMVIKNAAVNATINVEVKMEAGQVTAALQTYSQQRNQGLTNRNRPALRLNSFVPAGQRE